MAKRKKDVNNPCLQAGRELAKLMGDGLLNSHTKVRGKYY